MMGDDLVISLGIRCHISGVFQFCGETLPKEQQNMIRKRLRGKIRNYVPRAYSQSSPNSSVIWWKHSVVPMV